MMLVSLDNLLGVTIVAIACLAEILLGLILIMFRNQYDTDVTVWSPEGRLLQVWIGIDVDRTLFTTGMVTWFHGSLTTCRFVVVIASHFFAF